MRQKSAPLRQAVDQFFRASDSIARTRNDQIKQLKKNGINISRSYYMKIAPSILRVKTIKTGGCNCNQSDIIECIINRALFGLNMKSALAMDEKIFAPKNYKNPKAVVHFDHKGFLRGTFQKVKDDSFINLELCVNAKGIVAYSILERPSNESLFDEFINVLLDKLCNLDTSFAHGLVLDNGKFHQITTQTKLRMKNMNLMFLFDPPNGCYFNPCEEIFALIDKQLIEKLKDEETITKNIIKKNLVIILDNMMDYDFKPFFERALIPPREIQYDESIPDFQSQLPELYNENLSYGNTLE